MNLANQSEVSRGTSTAETVAESNRRERRAMRQQSLDATARLAQLEADQFRSHRDELENAVATVEGVRGIFVEGNLDRILRDDLEAIRSGELRNADKIGVVLNYAQHRLDEAREELRQDQELIAAAKQAFVEGWAAPSAAFIVEASAKCP